MAVTVAALVGLPALAFAIARWRRPSGSWEPPYRSLGAIAVDGIVALACFGFAQALTAAVGSARGPRARLAIERLLAFALPCAALAFATAHPFADAMRGDGYRWLHAAGEAEFLPSEPLGRYAHHLVFLAMRALGMEGDSSSAVRASSVLAGVAAASALTALAPRAFPRGDVFSVVTLAFFAPTAVLYFGYPETTPWAYAWLTAYLVSGLAYLHDPDAEAPRIASGLLALALFTHGFVLFAGASHAVLIAAYWRRSHATRRFARTALYGLLPLLPLAATLLYAAATRTGDATTPALGNALGGGDARMWVVAPGAAVEDWNGLSFVYRFLGRMHREGLTMLCVFAAPALVLAPRALAGALRSVSPRADDSDVDAARFLALAAGGLLVLPLAWNADLGMLRDFDLMAAFSVPTTLLAIHTLVARVDPSSQRAVATAVVPFTWAILLRPWLEG